jgi:hypothetical protein
MANSKFKSRRLTAEFSKDLCHWSKIIGGGELLRILKLAEDHKLKGKTVRVRK